MVILNTSSVMYFGWVCGWRKQLFEGRRSFHPPFIHVGKLLGSGFAPCAEEYYFSPGYKFCFPILFPSRGTICGAAAWLSCWFGAGVCPAWCLAGLGSVLGLAVPSAGSPGALPVPPLLLLLSSARACPCRRFCSHWIIHPAITIIAIIIIVIISPGESQLSSINKPGCSEPSCAELLMLGCSAISPSLAEGGAGFGKKLLYVFFCEATAPLERVKAKVQSQKPL